MRSRKINRCGYAAIFGRPNVGKSTLLNRLVGHKLTITSHKAQTTRHAILGINTTPAGQIIYVDTPGIHNRANHAMNRHLNRAAISVIDDVNVIIFVTEALHWTDEDEKGLRQIAKTSAPVVLAINKIDRISKKERLLPYISNIEKRHAFHEVIPISAKTNANIDKLEKAVLIALPDAENLFPDDQLSDRPEKFFAAELIREQLTQRYSRELPYAVSVEIEKFHEKNNLYHIGAVIWVEKDSQKGIIIGKDGQSLKQAASGARKEMERFFDHKVHLEVWVKVKKSWSSDEAALARLGYSD